MEDRGPQGTMSISRVEIRSLWTRQAGTGSPGTETSWTGKIKAAWAGDGGELRPRGKYLVGGQSAPAGAWPPGTTGQKHRQTRESARGWAGRQWPWWTRMAFAVTGMEVGVLCLL